MELTPSLLPRLLILSPSIAFLIEFIVYLVQYSHLSSSPDSNYNSITSYIEHVVGVNALRYKILASMLTLFTTLLSCVLFSKLWDLARRSIWLFIIVYDIFVLIIDQIPQALLQEYFVNNSSLTFFQIILNLLFSLINSVIAEFIIMGILNVVAYYSKLQPDPEPQPNENNQNLTIDDNADNANNANATTNNRPRCSCCIGHFWLIIAIVLFSAVFLFNFYSVDIIMIEEDNFVRIDNITIAKSISDLTESLGFPYDNVYMQVEGQPNAFYTGIFNKKVIIIAKSLMSLFKSTEHLCAVVAHELGHWAHKDMVVSFILSMFTVAILSSVFFFIQKVGLSSIGLSQQMPVVIVFICASTLFMLPQLMIAYTINLMTRSFERNADCFAASLGYPIGEALTILSEFVYDEIESAQLYSVLYENHPPLSKRIENIKKCIAK